MGKCDKIVIGGGMVFTFLKARGLSTGSSLVEVYLPTLASACFRLGHVAREQQL